MRLPERHGKQRFQSAYWNPESGRCDATRVTVSFMERAEWRGVERVVGRVRSSS
jgi:hypothetical protein